MGLRIIEDNQDGYAVLYCSTTMTALPWIFQSLEDAEAFIEKHGDVRRLSQAEQETLFEAFVAERARRDEEARARRKLASLPRRRPC